MHLMTEYFEEHMLIEQPDETPEQLLARYQQQARAWRHRQRVEGDDAAAMFAGDLAHMLEQLTGALAAALPQRTPSAEGTVVQRVEDELEYRVRTAVAQWKAADHDGRDSSAVVNEEVRGGRVAVRAYLARPAAPAVPASIADMVPGTTFTAVFHGEQDRFFRCRESLARAGRYLVSMDAIDPSTIRDVTPPPATSEAGA
jgi:hypothetical protein